MLGNHTEGQKTSVGCCRDHGRETTAETTAGTTAETTAGTTAGTPAPSRLGFPPNWACDQGRSETDTAGQSYRQEKLEKQRSSQHQRKLKGQQ